MAIKHALLALLSQGNNTAASLQTAFDEATGSVWPLNIGQVAQTLTRLERDQLIEQSESLHTSGRAAKVYTLTESGQSELDQWWTTAHKRSENDRDELVTKVAVALAVGLTPKSLLKTFDTQRQSTIAELGSLNRAAQALPEAHLPERLALERKIFELEAEVRWLERAESLIKNQPQNQPKSQPNNSGPTQSPRT